MRSSDYDVKSSNTAHFGYPLLLEAPFVPFFSSSFFSSSFFSSSRLPMALEAPFVPFFSSSFFSSSFLSSRLPMALGGALRALLLVILLLVILLVVLVLLVITLAHGFGECFLFLGDALLCKFVFWNKT